MITPGRELQWVSEAGGELVRRQAGQGQIELSIDEPLITSGILVTGTMVGASLFASLTSVVHGPVLVEYHRCRIAMNG